jgi:hypothetical protein
LKDKEKSARRQSAAPTQSRKLSGSRSCGDARARPVPCRPLKTKAKIISRREFAADGVDVITDERLGEEYLHELAITEARIQFFESVEG